MNTAIDTTTAATVTPFIQNLKQQQQQKPQTSKEAIAANVKALIEQLEEGHSEGLTAYLMAMAGSTTTASETSWRSQGRSRARPALPGCTRGTSLAAGQQRRKGHPHLGSHDRRSSQSGWRIPEPGRSTSNPEVRGRTDTAKALTRNCGTSSSTVRSSTR